MSIQPKTQPARGGGALPLHLPAAVRAGHAPPRGPGVEHGAGGAGADAAGGQGTAFQRVLEWSAVWSLASLCVLAACRLTWLLSHLRPKQVRPGTLVRPIKLRKTHKAVFPGSARFD